MPSRFIDVVVNGGTSFFFLWLNNVPLCIYTTCLNCSSIGGHLGCFCGLALVTNAAANTGVQNLFNALISFPLDEYPEVELLCHKVALVLIS